MNRSSLLLDIDRQSVWRHALIFYKSKSWLKRPLSVSFDGSNESGIDAGALKQEFFEILFRIINEDLFEGNERQRIPARGWEKTNLQKMAGIMIAHSILHGGPSFPVLARFVYRYIVTRNTELAAGYIEVGDLPHHSSYTPISTFIDQVQNKLKKFNLLSLIVTN